MDESKIFIWKHIAGWCKGSTRGSGPRSPGSNPGPAAVYLIINSP